MSFRLIKNHLHFGSPFHCAVCRRERKYKDSAILLTLISGSIGNRHCSSHGGLIGQAVHGHASLGAAPPVGHEVATRWPSTGISVSEGCINEACIYAPIGFSEDFADTVTEEPHEMVDHVLIKHRNHACKGMHLSKGNHDVPLQHVKQYWIQCPQSY